MSSPHANISVFVPHLGCPGRCSFCNQNHITGHNDVPTAKTVEDAINTAKLSKCYNPKNTELAFFGGSFTAISRDYMLELLKAGHNAVLNGDVSGIRISTRPDAIDDEILSILKQHSVTAIELGSQSLDDKVLSLNRRGHTKADVIAAAKLIKKYGFSLGLQMMTGLLGDSDEKAINTAAEFIKLLPETVRIYPTIVLKHTYLEKLYSNNSYLPQTLNEAVNLSAKLVKMFSENNISVIRLGLHTIDEQFYVAGPWHAAFGEMVQAKIYLENILDALKNHPKGDYVIEVKNTDLSKAIGQKKSNIIALANIGYNVKIKGVITPETNIKIIKSGE